MEAMSGRMIDRIGAVASAVCAVHCVLTGIALGLLSYVGLGFMGSPIADAIFLGIAVVIAVIAIVHGVRRHNSYKPAMVFSIGLVMVVLGHFVLHRHSQAGVHQADILSSLFSVSGGMCFVLFHVMNLRMKPACDCRHCKSD
jgi:drug/metabolite transporter (DMT)-like permease